LLEKRSIKSNISTLQTIFIGGGEVFLFHFFASSQNQFFQESLFPFKTPHCLIKSSDKSSPA